MVESSQKSYAIGIDLGTTYSCVAVWKDSKVQIIDIIPSIVGFTAEGAKLVGRPALAQQQNNVKNTVYDAKRLIGRKITDEAINNDLLTWPFKVE